MDNMCFPFKSTNLLNQSLELFYFTGHLSLYQ